MHTCPNGKRYIGITSGSVKQRWNYGNGYKEQYFWTAISRFGWNNIKHEVLYEDLDVITACDIEKELIRKYKSNNVRYGYNIDSGGIRELREDIPVLKYSLDKKFICEYKDISIPAKELNTTPSKIMACCRCHQVTCKGYFFVLKNCNCKEEIIKSKARDYRNRIDYVTYCVQKKWKNEDYKNMIISKRKENPNYKPKNCKAVCKFTTDGKFVEEFKSANEAKESVGLKSKDKILKCCNGQRNTAGGYIWLFKTDMDNAEEIIRNRNKGKEKRRCNIGKGTTKEVCQFDLNGKYIASYESCSEAGRVLGVPFSSNISQSALHHKKSAHGYLWAFKKDLEISDIHFVIKSNDKAIKTDTYVSLNKE